MDIDKIKQDLKDLECSKDLARLYERADKNNALRHCSIILKSIIASIRMINTIIEKESAIELYKSQVKPLIENYANIENIFRYKQDYIYALIIDGAVKESKSRKYKKNGLVATQFGIESKDIKPTKELEEVIVKYYNKILNREVKELFSTDNKQFHSKYDIKVKHKILLLKNDKDLYLRKDYVVGLYDLVNSYTHSNTYHLANINIDNDKAKTEIEKFIINIIERLKYILPYIISDFEMNALYDRISLEKEKQMNESIVNDKRKKYLIKNGFIVLQPIIDLKSRGHR